MYCKSAKIYMLGVDSSWVLKKDSIFQTVIEQDLKTIKFGDNKRLSILSMDGKQLSTTGIIKFNCWDRQFEEKCTVEISFRPEYRTVILLYADSKTIYFRE
jgi:hypothetical protein